MIKKITKGFLVLSFLALLLAPAALVRADNDPYGIGPGEDGLGDVALNPELDPRSSAISIINLVLSFLGLVAVVIILVGGFKWMTSGGNPEKVGSAKKLLISGLIGLVIVLLSWGIATWVIGAVDDFS